ITGRIVDEAILNKDLAMLIKLLILAFITLIASQVIGVVESYVNAWISQRVIFDMKNQMYGHLQRMPHAFFTTEKQGDIITRMNSDISGVSSVISGTLSSIVSNLATLVVTLIALFSMNWQLAIIGILVIPLLILPSKAVGKKRYNLLTAGQAKRDEMNQMINETLSVSGSLLTKIFAREEKEYAAFVDLNEDVTRLSLKEQRSGRWFRVVMGIFTQLGPLLIYFFGGLFIIRNFGPALTVGTITATVALVNRLYRPVESLTNIHVDFTRSLALFTRIFDYLDREITITSPENGLTPDMEMQDIAYEHVAFSYDEGNPILTDISFTVPGGRMYAVVGPSGSGKSTIGNLIPRLYDPDSGAVKIGGTDVREMDLAWLRKNVGMVTQDTYLFNGTILDNLLYAKEDASMEEVEKACRAASIHDFIISQPEGYKTLVGNRGLKLSGGEKQRLSIARVILKDPKILILDEATSALDSISENAIREALEGLMKNRTSIVIAHRLSTILSADSILVVKNGVIAEQGTHEELLSENGIYRQLYETQFRDALEYEASHASGILPSGPEDHSASGSYDHPVFGPGSHSSRGAEDYPGHGTDRSPVSNPNGQASPGSDGQTVPGTARFRPELLANDFTVKQLDESDITDVFRLCRDNRRFFRMLKIRPGRKMLTDIVTNPPADAGQDTAKYCFGFYDQGQLTAVLDLVLGYPKSNDAFIGWFVVAAGRQHEGIGSQIIADLRAAVMEQGYDYLSVSSPSASEDAAAFWTGQGFRRTGETTEQN
ncbi:MAG: ATP-binding cassette domain-containing protein, partial [Lachnospiraceae bacterium]|nr:ATP-binding cassette domain-containing protein [Lachnospiraceae bacterium]